MFDLDSGRAANETCAGAKCIQHRFCRRAKQTVQRPSKEVTTIRNKVAATLVTQILCVCPPNGIILGLNPELLVAKQKRLELQ